MLVVPTIRPAAVSNTVTGPCIRSGRPSSWTMPTISVKTGHPANAGPIIAASAAGTPIPASSAAARSGSARRSKAAPSISVGRLTTPKARASAVPRACATGPARSCCTCCRVSESPLRSASTAPSSSKARHSRAMVPAANRRAAISPRGRARTRSHRARSGCTDPPSSSPAVVSVACARSNAASRAGTESKREPASSTTGSTSTSSRWTSRSSSSTVSAADGSTVPTGSMPKSITARPRPRRRRSPTGSPCGRR